MGEFKVLYLCDFCLTRNFGKEIATRHKLDALHKKVDDLKVISNPVESQLLHPLFVFLLDIYASFYLLIYRPAFFISRGYSGYLSIKVAKILDIVSVREVHANAHEESDLLPYRGVKLSFIKKMARLSDKIDCSANIRIFNHPDLLAWYRKKGLSGRHDFYVYNGFDPKSKSTLLKSEARERFGLDSSDKVIAFIGAASKWHGVEYLVELQREFNRHGDGIKVVFGGGDISYFDRRKICINYTPLDQEGCADLVKAADYCALPVRCNRISPGSPLKLYDYILNERFIFAQADTNGYSDEVKRLNVGDAVDFTNPSKARQQIMAAFFTKKQNAFPDCQVSWSDRMDSWMDRLIEFRQGPNPK